jgi:ADP-heptose:LPS heptosyltransferase
MFRDSVLERINGFEPKLYSWFREETQCSWRVHVEGFKVVVHPRAEAWHLRADSGGTRPLGNKALDDARAFSLQRKTMKPGIHISLTHAIGDLIMATPAISALRSKFPDRDIVLYHPYGKDVFQGNPDVNHIAKTYHDEHRTCRFEKSIYSWMAENKWQGHMCEAYCRMLGVDAPELLIPKLYDINPQQREREYVVITPQSNAKLYDFSDISRTKYWPVERWQEVIDFMSGELGFEVVHLTGEEVHDQFSNVTSINNLSFRDAWGCIAGARLLVSIDTMGAHVAAAMDVPAVVLWGRTSPNTYGYDKPNIVNLTNKCPEDSPCFGGVMWQQDKKQCPLVNHPCMNNTTVDMVKGAIRRLIKG